MGFSFITLGIGIVIGASLSEGTRLAIVKWRKRAADAAKDVYDGIEEHVRN